MTSKPQPGDEDAIPVLTFNVAEQTYGLLIQDVLEVAAMVALTHVPDVPPATLGIANRHGEALPIIDFRQVLRLPEKEISSDSLFVVIQDEKRKLGLVVDHVHGVMYLPSTMLDQPSTSGRFIRGMINNGDGLIQLVAVDTLLNQYFPEAVKNPNGNLRVDM